MKPSGKRAKTRERAEAQRARRKNFAEMRNSSDLHCNGTTTQTEFTTKHTKIHEEKMQNFVLCEEAFRGARPAFPDIASDSHCSMI